jgi:hypothetical protein
MTLRQRDEAEAQRVRFVSETVVAPNAGQSP